MHRIISYIITLILFIPSCWAEIQYGYIKSNEVNVREGPGQEYEVIWRFIKKNEPVKILRDYASWFLVEDYEGDSGWVNKSLVVAKNKFIIVTKDNTLMYKDSSSQNKMIAKIASQVRCQLIECQKNNCKINCQDSIGWVEKKLLWGIK